MGWDEHQTHLLQRAKAKDPTLTILNLEGRFSFTQRLELDAADAQVLADSLKENTILTTLELGWNYIGPSSLRVILESLRSTQITSLYLQGNPLGDEGVKQIAEFLHHNTTLILCNVYHTECGPAAVAALAHALTVNHTLENLSLGDNTVTPAAVYALVDALKVNRGLQTLILNRLAIDDAAAAAFADMLRVNTTLTTIELCGTLITDVGAQAICESLRVNFAIRYLDLPRSISASLLQTIASLLDDPVREAWAAGEADTKPAREIPLEHGE
eukprot:m.12516 g.12516  ORF g.12516 m.12516 type:complete len:272 (-) comp6025_c0_seq1:24-839(-)